MSQSDIKPVYIRLNPCADYEDAHPELVPEDAMSADSRAAFGAEVVEVAALVAELHGLLSRYRQETPTGHQPYMIADDADTALAKASAFLATTKPGGADGR